MWCDGTEQRPFEPPKKPPKSTASASHDSFLIDISSWHKASENSLIKQKKEKIYYNVQWLGKINARIFKHQVLLFRGNFRNLCSLSNADPLPPPSPQTKAKWGLGNSREARERDDGNERRARAGSDGKETEREGKGPSLFLPFPSLPSSPLSLIILNSNITQ